MSLKNRSLVPAIQPEPDFSCTCGIVLDNVELIMYMKFHKILITGCRDISKRYQKCPKKGVFQKSGSVTFIPLWCPNFMQKLEKTNRQS